MPRTKSIPVKNRKRKAKAALRSVARNPTKKPLVRPTKKATMTPSDSEQRRQLVVVAHPFSQATPNPKIPDGKVKTSLAKRFRRVEELTVNKTQTSVDGTTVGAGICYVLLHPILGLSTYTINGNNFSTKSLFFQNQSFGWRAKAVAKAAGINDTYTHTISVENHATDHMSRWRLVSQGLRLTNVNNVEENDGWFEACRISPSIDPKYFTLRSVDNALTNSVGATTFFGPDTNIIAEINKVDMVEQSGYMTGSFRDLEKKEFNLHPVSISSKMCSREDLTNLTVGNADAAFSNLSTSDGIASGAARLASNADGKVVRDSFYDSMFDCILIKLHGRTGTGEPSRFILDAIQNVEYTMHPESNFKYLETNNDDHPMTGPTLDAMTNDPAPAKTRGM